MFIPFGVYNKEDVIKLKTDFIPLGVELIFSGLGRVEGDANKVHLEGGKVSNYDFYTVEGAVANKNILKGLTV